MGAGRIDKRSVMKTPPLTPVGSPIKILLDELAA